MPTEINYRRLIRNFHSYERAQVIDYSLIAEACEYYELFGYSRIEVPWWATADIVNITKPTGVSEDNNYQLSVNGKCLLASGEQGFLYLANKGQLPPGRYQTVTPCFRNEPYDRYHVKHFMKLELIQLCNTPIEQSSVEQLAGDALALFKKLAPTADLRIIKTGVKDPIALPFTEQLDIVLHISDKQQIELGFYGARHAPFAVWLYGTGIAEPRFSRAMREAS